MIETLLEYRQATISEVVTQGLDPTAPKTPSGLPWLGEVPAHWAIKSLRRVTDGLAMNGIFKKNDEFGDGAPLVNVTDLFSDNFFVDGSSLERVRCSEQELIQYQVCDGDLFLVRSSLKFDGIAMFAVARNIIEPTVFECHVVRLRPDTSLCNSRFMAFFLNSSYGRQSLISRSKSTTMTTIDQGEVLSTYIASPPLDEQKAIAAYLDRETAHIDKLVDHVRDEIKLLQELRAATITDAVTGKIKVS
ncbi:Type I restriction-modification system, specificity subunit S [Candidatus Nitrotoga arctica]|uniref:Type I restriction-modification system, specificity subunit S n=1 Tax=Candidatus Nitrotoga arctica TaxID=453162 RepID=A0ABN8ALY2_9PROT|nr:Type I restriction-modification system, specificity subunit S [Candidatus Nitrotoga arctica]